MYSFETNINRVRKRGKLSHHTARKVMTVLYFLATLLALCVVCGILLALPVSQREHVSALNIIFTAVSTVTLTGIVTVNTATSWTPAGLTILMIITQLAAMTYIILAAAVALEMGIRLKHNIPKSEQNKNNKQKKVLHGDFLYFAKFVIIFIFLIEIAGAVLFFLYYCTVSTKTISGNIFAAVFNAVSGFCNGGLILYNDGVINIFGLHLPPITHNIPQMLIFAVLALIGGLGFVVLYELIFLRTHKQLSLHTKLVLSTTAIFLVICTAVFYIYELSPINTKTYLFADTNKLNAFVTSIFMPISARGLGIASVDLTMLSAPTYFFLSLLMFIGGAPGGMSSGIKITTVAIIVISIWTQLRRKQDIEIFKRRISNETVRFALTIVTASFLFIILCVWIVGITEANNAHSSFGFASYAYIISLVISAFSNIGFDPNIAGNLTPVTKSIIIVIMLVGRVSSVLFFYVFASPAVKQLRRYPIEPILEG